MMLMGLRFMLLCALVGTGATARAGENLRIEGIPPIPADVVERVQRYTEFRAAGFSSWHPTRPEMLVNTRFADTAQIHHLAMPMGARTQLTFSREPSRGGSFQPTSGQYFILARDTGGTERYQFYRYDLVSGEETLLTDGASRNTGGRWSSDGNLLAFGSTRRNGADVDLYLMNPLDPTSTRMLAEMTGGGWSVSDFSPDDRAVIVFESISAESSHLWLMDIESGERRRITPMSEENVRYGGATFARDGQGIYVTTDRDSEFRRLAHIDLQTSEHTYLTTHIPWDIESVDLSKDGRTIALIVNEDGVSRLRLLDTDSGTEHPAPELPAGVIGSLRWHNNNRDLGFTLSSARSPSDAYSFDLETGQVHRWTRSETGGINPDTFVEPRIIRCASFDGTEICAFIYMPPSEFQGKRPVVINIHGGPESQARPGFLGRTNYLLNELGVAIIYPNVRGSSGYGKTFLAMDNATRREDAYKDIGALLDWIATQDNLDADRVMVTGVSYGGHMTFAVATMFPDRIRCAMPVVGMSNLVTFLERTESYRRDLRRVEYGDERDPQVRAFLERIAPLNNAQRIRAPMFIVQGANDPRVPASEAEQMVARVREVGTPVWYLLALDEGHGFAKKKNADYLFYAQIMFMREFLLN